MPDLQAEGSPALRPRQIGSMTAVMRAAAVTQDAPRVPRIAVVVGGRIVDERLFRDAGAVTVGTAEDATFTIGGAALPERFVLVERVGTRHYLRFIEGMTGRIALGNERLDLSSLAERAHESRGARRIELTNDARGKVVLGGVTFLFQLVPPPPLPTTPRLPLGVRGGLGTSVDWRLAIIAAMSFLAHFAFVGGAYSDWMDPVVDTDRNVAALIDLKRNLPDVPVEDPKTTTTESPTTAPKKADDVVAKTGPVSPPGPTTRKTSGPTSISDKKAADLAERADAMQIGMIASLQGGPATRTAIDRNDEIPPVDLGSAAASAKGVATANDPLGVSRTGGPVKPATNNGLANLANTHGDANQGPGVQGNAPAGPSLSVDVRPPSMIGPPLNDADRVVAGLRPRFRKCYQDGLNDDPTMAGKTVLAAKVQPNGEVASVEIAENQGLSPKVTACMSRALKNAQFTGNGAFSTVRVPVTMIQNR